MSIFELPRSEARLTVSKDTATRRRRRELLRQHDNKPHQVATTTESMPPPPLHTTTSTTSTETTPHIPCGRLGSSKQMYLIRKYMSDDMSSQLEPGTSDLLRPTASSKYDTQSSYYDDDTESREHHSDESGIIVVKDGQHSLYYNDNHISETSTLAVSLTKTDKGGCDYHDDVTADGRDGAYATTPDHDHVESCGTILDSANHDDESNARGANKSLKVKTTAVLQGVGGTSAGLPVTTTRGRISGKETDAAARCGKMKDDGGHGDKRIKESRSEALRLCLPRRGAPSAARKQLINLVTDSGDAGHNGDTRNHHDRQRATNDGIHHSDCQVQQEVRRRISDINSGLYASSPAPAGSLANAQRRSSDTSHRAADSLLGASDSACRRKPYRHHLHHHNITSTPQPTHFNVPASTVPSSRLPIVTAASSSSSNNSRHREEPEAVSTTTTTTNMKLPSKNGHVSLTKERRASSTGISTRTTIPIASSISADPAEWRAILSSRRISAPYTATVSVSPSPRPPPPTRRFSTDELAEQLASNAVTATMGFPTIKELGKLPYAKQCAFFINAFFTDGLEEHCNEIYTIYEKFVSLDAQKEQGNELNEFDAHRLLEAFNETLSVRDMRDLMKLIDQDFNNNMSAIEYLTFKYGKTVKEVCETPQGDNKEAIAAAMTKLQEVQLALADVEAKLAASKEALGEATEAHEKATHEENKLATLQAELKAAVADLQSIEEEFKAKMESLEVLMNDMNLGPVKRNKAANELEQMKGEDPLPLRKAKITQEAALRKVTKQKVNAEIATQKAASTKKTAEEAKAQLEAAYADLEVKMTETAQEVEEAKTKSSPAHGDFYMMERALFIADKSLPAKRQKYDHNKPFKYIAVANL